MRKKVLDDLAASENLWKQRMSIVCTWKTSQMGDPSWCLRYAIEKMSEKERKEWMNADGYTNKKRITT